MRIRSTIQVVVGLLAVAAAFGQTPGSAEGEFHRLRDGYVAKYQPLWLESTAAFWEANTTGTDAAVARRKAADAALVDLHSDAALFERLKTLRAGGQVTDPVLRRELEVMYLTMAACQGDRPLQKRIIELETEVEQIFNNFRPQVGDKTLTENDVREILATTKDSAAAEAAWTAYMEIGVRADAKLRELVRLRNELARQIGYPNYYAMRIGLQEIDVAELARLFDELDELTRAPFATLKTSIDASRAARFGIATGDLRPWHFGDLFFQDPPDLGELDVDDLFKNADLVELSRSYYAGLGLPVDDILAHSDLYERPGKHPHGYCVDMDRAGDVRILINLKPNVYWADTIMHELGHAVYSKYIRPDVPFLLRDASHPITTEGLAELLGALVKNGEWLTNVLKVEPAVAARASAAARDLHRTEELMFSRWAQVMLRFEQGMYSNPDQDLSKLWWDLKRRYQLLHPPRLGQRPDYAAKVHILATPVYYHSYMMGELFAAQVRACIAREVLHAADPGESSYFRRPEVGAYLKEKILGPGNLYSWNELTRRATGQPLTAKYFAEEFVRP